MAPPGRVRGSALDARGSADSATAGRARRRRLDPHGEVPARWAATERRSSRSTFASHSQTATAAPSLISGAGVSGLELRPVGRHRRAGDRNRLRRQTRRHPAADAVPGRPGQEPAPPPAARLRRSQQSSRNAGRRAQAVRRADPRRPDRIGPRSLTALNLGGLKQIEAVGVALIAAVGVAVLGAFLVFERRTGVRRP